MPDPSRRLLLIAAPAIILAGPALAQARKTVAVREAFPFLDRYLGLPAAQRTRFQTAYYLRRDGASAAGVRGWFVLGDARTPMRTGPDGRVSPLPTLAQWRDANLELDAPADSSFSVSMSIEPTLAPASTMAAAPLAQAVEQAQAAVRRAAGVLRFAAPRFTRVMLVDAGSARVVLADGREIVLPRRGSHPTFEPSGHPSARTIRCEQVPTRLQISTDG